tara:strand:+ start:96 stop:308 length:213 start_codon:yes stop_codon:yes gene_type:complete
MKMSDATTLQKISEDLDFLKEKIGKIEGDVEEINLDLHRRVKPSYLEKLKKIDEGKFLSEEEFEREIAEE